MSPRARILLDAGWRLHAGDPTDMTPFPSHERAAFSGLALAIVRAVPGRTGTIVVRTEADGLQGASARIVLETKVNDQ